MWSWTWVSPELVLEVDPRAAQPEVDREGQRLAKGEPERGDPERRDGDEVEQVGKGAEARANAAVGVNDEQVGRVNVLVEYQSGVCVVVSIPVHVGALGGGEAHAERVWGR